MSCCTCFSEMIKDAAHLRLYVTRELCMTNELVHELNIPVPEQKGVRLCILLDKHVR